METPTSPQPDAPRAINANALSEDRPPVRETILTVDGRPARAFVGGQGEPMVLVHGGWGGASTHWRSVWGPLSDHFRVVAPDLPGIGAPSLPGLDSVEGYARWLKGALDALDVPRAWLVGNSFGASVVCRFALDFPARCRGLVLVNGFPMPRTPAILRWLGERELGQRLMRTIERRVAYTPRAVERGFFNSANVPDEIRSLADQKSPPQVPTLAHVLVRGGGSAGVYPVAPLLLWGEEDHLPGTSRRDAERLNASWRGGKLSFVPHAGHMPQVENPREFVTRLLELVQEAKKTELSNS